MLRLWLITRGAVPHPDKEDRLDPAQAPLWGLGRVIGNENPDLVCKLIDLCPGEAPQALTVQLLAELNAPDEEDEILLSAGETAAVNTDIAVIEEDRG